MSVPVKIYRTVTYQEGQTPSNPNLSGDPVVNPINPNGGAAEELVPYDGAIKDVNLGEQGLSTGFVQYDNTPTDTPTGSGTVVWNPDKYTLDLSMGLGDSVQQIGMETYYTPVKNQTGSLIPDGTFVMATGSLGASGRITVAPAVTDGSVDSRYMLGVTTHDIADGGDGLVTWFGEIRGFNTNTKAPVGETWVDGTVLWNNPAVAGGFTSVEPQAPNLKIPVAIVISAGNNGVIFVRPRLGMRLTDLHDVDAFTPSDKNLISYDSALGHWNAKSLGSVIGGTSSQFLKGDGSLDSNSYALASQINIASGQVAFGTGSNTIGGGNITWNNASNILELIGASTIRTSTGNLVLTTSAGNGSVILIPNGSGNTQIRNGGEPIRMGADANLTTLSSNTSKRLRISIPQYGNPYSTPIGLISAGADSSSNGIDIGGIQGGFSLAADQIRVNVGATYNALTQVQVGRFTSTGLGLGNIAPTNTLDVNGTARIRTLSNATGDFVTASATGVLQKRTASETLADIGGIGGTIATGQVAFGTGVNTIGGNADFVWDNSSKYLNILVSGTQIARLGNGIGTLQGVLQLYTSAGVENIRLRAGSISYINNTFGFGIGTTSPTNALDVAGQTRIRTIANGDGYFLTKNSNGVITASQSLYQLSTSVGIGLTNPSGGLHIRRDSLYNAEGNTSLIIDGGSVVGAVKLLIGVDTTNDVAYIESMQASTGWNKNLSIQAMGGLVGIATISPTNTLDVNGTARIRSLTGTTGYLTLLSSTGVMGQSVAYNADTGIVINGTFLPSGAVFSVNGVSYFNNWATAGAYDKLSIDFGENRGFGYDTTTNEIFVKGITTVPVKIDTDAPTDSLNVLSTGGVEMKNLQAGTISDNIGLNSSGELVKGVAGLVQSVSGTAVDNTDPLNPIVSVDNWTFETLIDTITLNDTNGNVTYTCNSTITIFTNSKLNIKTLYLNITNIASSGIPLGGAFEIKGYNFYNFIGANDISVLYEVKEFRGTSYTESLLPLLRPDALGTFDGQLIFRKINNTQQQPPFTSTNGEITIKIAKFKQS